jgi:hypothetical protein
MTTTPVASPPSLRRHFGSSAGCRWNSYRTPALLIASSWKLCWLLLESLPNSGPTRLVLAVVVYSPWGVPTSTPTFASFRAPHPSCVRRRIANALPSLFASGCFAGVVVLVIAFERMLCRHGCVGRVDALPSLSLETLCTFDYVGSFSRFKCMVVSRFVGLFGGAL